MRRWLILMLLLPGAPVAAQTAIHRCVAADGTPVFTDQPCANLSATPVGSGRGDAAMPDHAPPHATCPADLPSLKQRIDQAFAHHDANALAGLMLWTSYGRRSAIGEAEQLRELVKQPLLGFGDDISGPSERDDPAFAGLPPLAPTHEYRSAPTAPSPPSVDALDLHLGGRADRPDVRRYALAHRAGCVWLQP
ncbi:DUF4124 domain-containing protein [Oleiagrimonas sp. C23AA]|uniref:DUF4124 domain-containing protein n=1 Tax=Oleiagrimonas sp. C23AA TaxID=2719047 RepID=UPI0014217EE6|nr:DUF4124 domain-containing protein [Oleiagrimonas sp. C23AA]NII09848.1 DUF4124 domain-containing protein [Oleiagrimonas sp. C23AA]